MTRQRAAAAAEQLAALQAAAEDMQLARDSEQLALALALAQTNSGLTAEAPQVARSNLRTWPNMRTNARSTLGSLIASPM